MEETANLPTSVVFKRKAEWDGIRLEHVRLNTGQLPKHCHQQHTVLISLSDNCEGELATANGRMRGTRMKGNVCVLPSGLDHQATLDGESEHLALYVDPHLINRAASDAQLKGNFEIVERFVRQDRVITNVGFALLDELESRGVSGRLYAESLANLLAVHLLRHYSSENKSSRFQGGLSGQKLRQVNDFITENFADDIRLSELAQVAGMSEFHFAREFKRATGTSPHQYLIKFRVERAKTLLAKQELPLIEVGLQSGFSHQSHFTRLFRKVTGMTPNHYRSSFQS